MVNKKPIRGIITDQTCFECDRIIKKGEYAYLEDGEFRHIGCQEVSKKDFKKRYLVNKPGKKKAKKLLKETTIKVKKRRTKKDPLSIETPFIRIKEIRAKGRLKLASASDKVLMKASPTMWNDFHNAFLQDQKQFAREIYYNFIEPAIKKINHAPERGVQKNRTQLINKIMLDSAWLYCFVKYWNKCPEKMTYPKS